MPHGSPEHPCDSHRPIGASSWVIYVKLESARPLTWNQKASSRIIQQLFIRIALIHARAPFGRSQRQDR